MKNTGRNLAIIISMLVPILSSCSSNNLPDQKNPVVIGGYSSVMEFDSVKDASIGSSNNRIKTVENVASQNPSSIIIVRFNSLRGEKFARWLYGTYKEDGFSRVKLVGIADNSQPTKVVSYIKFLPLDLINESGEQIKQYHGGCPSCIAKKNAGGSISSTVNITDIVNQ